MQLNGITLKLRHKLKPKPTLVATAYCRWESARSNGTAIMRHPNLKPALNRAEQLHGCVRTVTYLPDGIVRHGEWRKV
jgi:hypothetical protein